MSFGSTLKSPLCEKCVDEGKLGQTYKIAGRPHFRCQSCKRIYQRGEFEPIQFEWANKPLEYLKWREATQKAEVMIEGDKFIGVKEKKSGA